jgi:hypothetical protein
LGLTFTHANFTQFVHAEVQSDFPLSGGYYPITRKYLLTNNIVSPLRTMRILLTLLMAAGFVGCATKRDYTVGASAVCEVHHCTMDKTIVPIHYGLMPFPPRSQALYAASTNSFPNADDSINPSCRVSRKREALIYTCPQCVVARQKWETDYDSQR